MDANQAICRIDPPFGCRGERNKAPRQGLNPCPLERFPTYASWEARWSGLLPNQIIVPTESLTMAVHIICHLRAFSQRS